MYAFIVQVLKKSNVTADYLFSSKMQIERIWFLLCGG